MNFKARTMPSVILVAFSLLSINFLADNLFTGSHNYDLPFGFALAEISDINSTKSLTTDGTPLADNTGDHCLASDPGCSAGESSGAGVSETGGGHCLASDPGCSGGESSGAGVVKLEGIIVLRVIQAARRRI